MEVIGFYKIIGFTVGLVQSVWAGTHSLHCVACMLCVVVVVVVV